MTKEYGGYLPLELKKEKAWYQGEDVVSLNAGRYAVVYALQEGAWNGVCLPYYLCGTVEEAIRKCLPKMAIRYYHIGEDLLPEDLRPEEDTCLLWVNYFGIQPEHIIDRMVERYGKRLIIDHTQSFYTRPREQAYQVYSCRKFFGVCDGSYVVHKGIRHRELPVSSSGEHAIHLLESLEHGTNYSYMRNKENENRLRDCGMARMSALTSALMEAADYEQVKSVRQRNMECMHALLKGQNGLQIPYLGPAMNYPFLSKREDLRERLTGQRIYVPLLWRETLENPLANSWEKYLSEHLCLLPVDQRYDEDDMKEIAKKVCAEEAFGKEVI